MTKLEEVTRAITEGVELQKVHRFAGVNYSGIIPPMRWEDITCAALLALREPSEDMLIAIAQSEGGPIENWQLMIDSVLSERSNGGKGAG